MYLSACFFHDSLLQKSALAHTLGEPVGKHKEYYVDDGLEQSDCGCQGELKRLDTVFINEGRDNLRIFHYQVVLENERSVEAGAKDITECQDQKDYNRRSDAGKGYIHIFWNLPAPSTDAAS